jgi:hypothetical protein
MNGDIFSTQNYAKKALEKFGEVPENFKIFKFSWKSSDSMEVTGAEFRAAEGATDSNLSVLMPGTERTVLLPGEELD